MLVEFNVVELKIGTERQWCVVSCYDSGWVRWFTRHSDLLEAQKVADRLMSEYRERHGF